MALSVLTGVHNARGQKEADLKRGLTMKADQGAAELGAYFERAKSINLLLAHNRVFADFYRAPGSRIETVRARGPLVRHVDEALAYLQRLYPGQISEACFIDRTGPENGRVVFGRWARTQALSQDESANPFFGPTFALDFGQVYQAQPYVSPDTDVWVISNSTLLPTPDGAKRAIVHFEVTVESFRSAAAAAAGRFNIAIVDGRSGAIILDSNLPQRKGAPLGRPADRSFAPLLGHRAPAGLLTLAGKQVAYRRLALGDGNANDWYVVASSPPVTVAWTAGFGRGPLMMMLAALALLGVAIASFRAYQRDLRRAALTDELTGLPNRVLFRDRMERGVLAGKRDGLLAAVMVIDLDRFKEVNDTLGHHNGDLLLKEVAERLAACVREGDTIARLGGDEFGILLPRLPDADYALAVAERTRNALSEALFLDGVQIQVDASVGIALYPSDGHDPGTLLQRADVAMYEAKRGHSGCAFYASERDQFSPERLAMVPELRKGIERGELLLHFQPKVDVATGRVHSAEALVRWEHPTLGLVMPDQFIKLAEDTGLIKQLTLFVVDRSLTQCRRWLDEGFAVPVSVNLSVRNLLDPHLLDEIGEALRRASLPAEMLLLEITESAMMADYVKALDVLTSLSKMGVRLSVDDFGTGYSSLAYLKELPLDELKIDRCFVMNMASDEADEMIVRSTIDLGRNLGLKTVAEGVEDEQTLEQLVRLGCDLAQGYLMSKPLPADELMHWLRANSDTEPRRIDLEASGDGAAASDQARKRGSWEAPSPRFVPRPAPEGSA